MTSSASARLPSPSAPAPLSDVEAVTRVLAGDVSAFEAIMRRHNQRLYRVARAVLREDAPAQDAVQEGYVKAYLRLRSLRDAAGLGRWLTRIVRNEALMMLRAGWRSVTMSEDAVIANGEAISAAGPRQPDAVTSDGELRRMMERAISDLPTGLREVFMLRGVEEMSVAEVAHALQIEDGTVKSRYHRARAALQRELDARLDQATRDSFSFDGRRCDAIVAKVMGRIRGIAALPS